MSLRLPLRVCARAGPNLYCADLRDSRETPRAAMDPAVETLSLRPIRERARALVEELTTLLAASDMQRQAPMGWLRRGGAPGTNAPLVEAVRRATAFLTEI